MDLNGVLLILGIMAALVYSFKVRNGFRALIVSVQIIAAALTLAIDKTSGLIVFGVAILLTFLYAMINNNRAKKNIVLVWLFITPIAIAYLFGVLNLAGFELVRLTLLVPIAIFVYAGFNQQRFKYEISFMIMFFVEALFRFIGVFY